MAAHAPEVVYSPDSDYSRSSTIEKDRDNKETITLDEKERTVPITPDAFEDVQTPKYDKTGVAPDTSKDIETQKHDETRRAWPWKWITGILVVGLCMLAVGIGIGYAVGESNDSGSKAVGSSAKAGFTQPPRADGRCGPQFGDATCDPTGGFGGCCSDKGWCGNNDAHCLVCKGCQWGCTNNSKICE